MDNHDTLPELTPHTYTSRELSWIEFNRRVLALAQDKRLPLLERVKFLAIFSSNLDEFYMVRVASWHNKMKLGMTSSRPDGYNPKELLIEIRKRVLELMEQQRETMREVLMELRTVGICIADIAELKAEERAALRAYFQDEVFPVLTPLAVDHARPFPFISNLSLNLMIWLKRSGNPAEELEFVRLKVPDVLPRLVSVGSVMRRYDGAANTHDEVFIWLEDIISDNLDALFPGMTVLEQHPFRVTRNADIDYEHEQEDRLLDISALIENSVRERQFGSVVRLSVQDSISERTLNRLVEGLKVDPEYDVYRIDGALGVSALFELLNIDRPDLKYPAYVPRIPETVSDKDIFSAIRQNDILLHHPYESFSPVEDFFWTAARDPNVLAIKATLYRVGKNSPIVQALAEARENDKQVAVLVELKARFDEENNLEWARVLEHKGVHVTYGVEELPVKTHAKVALVVRREADGVRRYVHLGTGNYNASTARMYTDIGLFTCDHEIGNDALALFNRLTGYAPGTSYRRLLVAPEYLLNGLIRLIDNEIAAAKAGKHAHLIFKMNQLEEDVLIQKLYQASQAGVKVDLIVRGLCCLRAGIPGYSEQIRVRSIVGRYLEHSRVYYFHNAPPDQRVYLGSADIMRRNLYNRVEVVFPVLDMRLQQRVRRILATCLADNQNTWELQPDGSYFRIEPSAETPPLDSQAVFMENSSGIAELPLEEKNSDF
jgi:polyphosphate kinase